VGTFVDSPIGFYHFVEPDQRTLSLQQWSTRTLEEFCRAEGKGVHYGIDQAGVWVDCVYERAPVIHNDYASLPHRKGIPEGHAEVIRELVVPVMRNDKVVAILGVGNKPTEYTQKDVGIVSYFADVTWEIVRRKRAEEALKESEEKLRLIFENAFDGISIHEELPGRSRRLLDCNDRYVEMSGRSKEELLEIQNTTLIQRTLGPFLSDEENLRIRRNRQTYHGIFSWIRPDGKENVIEYSAAPVSIGGRDLTIGVDRDITERKRVEEERERLLTQIREQIRQVQQIIDTVPEGVLLMDADGQVVLANPAAEIDLAVLGGAEVGDTITRLGNRSLPELLTSPPKGLWHEVASDDRVFEVIARPMENGPEPEDWVLVINDVTQEREIQRLIQQQERLAAVGQLAAGIAHDFNNIMASIVLYAQMTAQMEELPATVRERMETINHQAGHATRLIQQILDFSRRAVLERRPLDLGSLLKEHVRLLKRTLPESIKILLTYGPGEYVVRADPTRMQQMVTNLSLNARDAMPEGGTLCIGLERVEIKSGESSLLPEMKTGEWVQVTVSDTGAGIPPDALPHIFEPFFTTRAPLGSGLGLAQVHGIVGQHEGRIDVETQVGQGTTFTIYLPAHSPESSTLAAPQELSALFTGQREIILVVEDDVVVREALVESLEMLNYRVLEAASGQEALALLEQHGEEIMLVLSDVVMPGMGGIALLHALRERGLEIKVVMLTGHPMEREMEELQAQGMIDWLSKPASLRQLAGVLARALDRKTAGRS
jgi:two-component system cell cycle sensor histidine kinase/response regulator CckA